MPSSGQPDSTFISEPINAWNRFHSRWARLRPPLRPNAEVVSALAGQIAAHSANCLLLGVTPELAGIADNTLAVDHAATMIEKIWPGNTGSRRAVLGNWLALPLEGRQFSAVIGDGSLNAISYADYPRLFSELSRVLVGGARIALRFYETPDPCETVAQIREDVMSGREQRFHAFKWRLAMAIAAERHKPDLPVASIHAIFDSEFTDRAALAHATAWSDEDFAEMDAYRNQETVYSFPTRRELLKALPESFAAPRFASSGNYALAERCPILVADFAP